MTLIVVGGAAMVLYLAAVVFNRSIASWLLVTIYVLSVSLQFLTGLGAFLLWRERQYAAKADAERIITDSKPHVLYLRAFRSDPKVFSSMLGWQSGLETQEEQLAEVLRPIGELVAIGRPGERLPEPGAARIYASDEELKEVVKRQMQAARLVIIRAEVGENLLWELKHAVETLNPQKVLILILEMKAKHYESFRTEVNPILGLSLPEGATLWRRYRHVSGFIGFGAGRTPSVFPLGVPYFRTDYYKPYRQLFKFALRPVFESFGLEWQPPPDVFWFNVIGVLLGWLLGILWILNGILFFINRTNMLLASLFVIVLVLYVILRLARRILLG